MRYCPYPLGIHWTMEFIAGWTGIDSNTFGGTGGYRYVLPGSKVSTES